MSTCPALSARPDEAYYRRLFDVNPHPAWVFDEQTGRFLAVNEAAIRHYGYSHDEFLALSVRDVVPVEDAERLVGCEDEVAQSLQWRHRTKAGIILTIEASCCRVTLGDRPARLIVGSDLTDRRRAEQALREREELLRHVLAHIPCGVFWKDRASIYLGCNNQVAQDLGLSVPGEVIGRTDYELFPESSEADRSRAADLAVIQTGTPLLNAEEVRTLASGAKLTLLTSRVPLRDASGSVVGVIGVYQDLTARKLLEEQLRQSQKMEAIGRLAGGIAHDFNNLLTIILGNTSLLRKVLSGKAESVQLVDDIHGAADRAASLTRQLLTFSRPRSLHQEVVDLNEVVDQLAGLLRRLLGERISIATLLAPTPVLVRADRGQLEQVIMNLAVNAKDAMPTGGTLSICTSSVTTLTADMAAQRYARLAITDTGIGMTDEVKARIFEPFFTTKEVGRGTGLGLATVYAIIEAVGGRIEVESAPGAGTRFQIDLPLSEGRPSQSAERAMRTVLAGGNIGRGRSVLLVEDEEGIRRLARLTLESHGYEVLEAERGEAALELLAPQRRIDLVITDLIMPGLDGRELALRIRADRPKTGVVFMSGYVLDGLQLDDLPDALFLPKPFSPLELLKVVDRGLARVVSGIRIPVEGQP
jgi:two-component system cell cycle sensor histidine kinase/response regulator CckA